MTAADLIQKGGLKQIRNYGNSDICLQWQLYNISKNQVTTAVSVQPPLSRQACMQ